MALFSPSVLIEHINQYLPQLSDLFCDVVDVTGEIVSGDPQTLVITEEDHGRTVGQTILLRNVVIENAITAVTSFTDGDTVGLRFTTEAENDLTGGYSTVTLSGFDNDNLNDTFDVYYSASSTTFEIVTDEDAPDLTGDEVIEETWEVGPQGYREITEVTDDTYTVELTDLPTYATGTLNNIQVCGNWRITAAYDYNRASAMYTNASTDKAWLYVVMQGGDVSKDWRAESDALATFGPTSAERVKVMNSFTLLAFFNVSDELTAENAIETCWSDLLEDLWQTLNGKRFTAFDNTAYSVVPVSHGPTIYNSAYYAHAYEFQFTYEIGSEQGFNETFLQTRAYREYEIDIPNEPVIE